MKRSTIILAVVAAMMFGIVGFAVQADAARVYISPPAFVFDVEPELVVVPGTYVYRVPDIEADILFYQGYWYRPYEGRWYRSRAYNGPWGHIGRAPGALLRLPSGYRDWRYEDRHRMHYGDLHRNWRSWERNKHWDRDDRWREHRGDRGHDRGHDRGRDRGHDRGRDRGHDRGGDRR